MEFAEDQTLKAMSMYVVVLCIITLFAFTFKVLYNIYLHPLSAFKGPKYLIASEISLAVLQLHGTSHYALRKAHEKYGCIVRISPSTLSFISPSAWNDIYGHRKGHPNLPKDPLFFNESLLDKKTITMTSDFDAVPIRRAMNPAFSHKALLEQEPMVQSHFKRLVAQLFRASYDIDEGKSRSVDLQKWFTWSMFDINADFSFGEDMGCVASGSPQQWVQFVTDNFYAATFLHQFHKFLPFKRIPDILVPKSLREQKERHNEASLARVRRRMDRKTDRHDFMYHFLEHARKNGLSTPVIEAQASIIILAGSETSAVALSASIYHILNNSHVYKQLCEEIRDAFTTAEGITYNVVSRLPYLEAVVQESLRLHTPIANGFNRVVADPKGAMINGHRVPQGTVVTINHYCSNTSTRNFRDPFSFIPERWLNYSTYDSDVRDVVQPFSIGSRSCPGKIFALNNIKLALAHLIWAFDMKLEEGAKDWGVGQKVFNGWLQPALPVFLERRALS